jgi:hypothetical protein
MQSPHMAGAALRRADVQISRVRPDAIAVHADDRGARMVLALRLTAGGHGSIFLPPSIRFSSWADAKDSLPLGTY